jgi:hypothetical protein
MLLLATTLSPSLRVALPTAQEEQRPLDTTPGFVLDDLFIVQTPEY